MDKLKLIWSEFLLLKMFPEWLWPLSSLSEVANRQKNLIFEARSKSTISGSCFEQELSLFTAKC